MNSHRCFSRHYLMVAFCIVALALATAATSAGASPNASYQGSGVKENGLLKLTTGATGNVSGYHAQWCRKVCGIPNFGIWFSTDVASDEITLGDDSRFVERFSFTYKSHGKKFRVRATSTGEFATFNQDPAYDPDQVRFKQTVKVKRVKKGARWCKPKAHSWIAFKL